MLIEFIDLVKPEKLGPMSDSDAVDPVVRLDAIDGLYRSIGHALYFSHLSGIVFAGRLEDWKVAISVSGLGNNRAVLYQVPGKMIQGASEILSDIPDQRRKLRRRLLANPDVICAFTSIRIVLKDGFVGAALSEEAKKRGIEMNDVLIGPIDFD
jgi:hypothetical protein